MQSCGPILLINYLLGVPKNEIYIIYFANRVFLQKDMTRFYLKFDRNQALQYQLQMVTELLMQNKKILQDLQQQNVDMKNMRNMLVNCPDTWKPLLKILKPVSKEADDEKKILFQQKVVQFLKTKFTAISLMIEDHKAPQVISLCFLIKNEVLMFSFRPGLNNTSKKCKRLMIS